MKIIILFLVGFVFGFFFLGSPHTYNTETICFDEEGKVAFYASGYSPNNDKSPLIKLRKGVYKIAETGTILRAHCNSSWGVSKPKGRKYWETN